MTLLKGPFCVTVGQAGRNEGVYCGPCDVMFCCGGPTFLEGSKKNRFQVEIGIRRNVSEEGFYCTKSNFSVLALGAEEKKSRSEKRFSSAVGKVERGKEPGPTYASYKVNRQCLLN